MSLEDEVRALAAEVALLRAEAEKTNALVTLREHPRGAISRQELADWWGVSPTTIATWAAERGLPEKRFGRIAMISVEAAMAWLNAQP